MIISNILFRAAPGDHGVRDVREAADVPARPPHPPQLLQLLLGHRSAHLARPHALRLPGGRRLRLPPVQGGGCHFLQIKTKS